VNAKVFWVDASIQGTGWFWDETDEHDECIGDGHGPFDSAIAAGADARKAIVAAAERQAIVFEDRS